MDLVLASQSPRRSELLRLAGFTFRVRSRPVEEVRAPGEAPRDYAMRLAREKAEAAWEDRDEVVLGADTIVIAGSRVLEKPTGRADAQAMIEALSGRAHTVITGICLRHPKGSLADAESTQVYFAELDAAEIDAYSPAASRWTKPERTASRAWHPNSWSALKGAISTSWDCPWRGYTGIGNRSNDRRAVHSALPTNPGRAGEAVTIEFDVILHYDRNTG